MLRGCSRDHRYAFAVKSNSWWQLLHFKIHAGTEDGDKRVEGYGCPTSPALLSLEGSYSYDEEDDAESRKESLDISRQLRVTLKEFYANLGDLTAPKRHQPGAHAFKQQIGGGVLQQGLGASLREAEHAKKGIISSQLSFVARLQEGVTQCIRPSKQSSML